MKEEDIALMNGITKKGEVIQTLDINSHLNECFGGMRWKEVGVMKPCSWVQEV